MIEWMDGWIDVEGNKKNLRFILQCEASIMLTISVGKQTITVLWLVVHQFERLESCYASITSFYTLFLSFVKAIFSFTFPFLHCYYNCFESNAFYLNIFRANKQLIVYDVDLSFLVATYRILSRSIVWSSEFIIWFSTNRLKYRLIVYGQTYLFWSRLIFWVSSYYIWSEFINWISTYRFKFWLTVLNLDLSVTIST